MLLALLAGCAEYKEYHYKEYTVSREQAFSTMVDLLHKEGYKIEEIDENYVNDLPEVYIETGWNLSQTGGVYHGNDQRRKAYVKITTLYSERDPVEHQPLSNEQGKEMRDLEKEEAKKAGLEQTRLGIAVRLERRSDISRPLESDWYYDGPDSYSVMELMGRFEAAWGEERSGGATKPSGKSEKLKQQELERNYGN